MFKKGPASDIDENNEVYHGYNGTETNKELLDNLKKYKSLSDEEKELILALIGEEKFDEKSLEELVGKTKEELERMKQDKDLILEITGNKSICISDLIELRKVMKKDYKKYIFDLDYTLLTPDWSCENNYFRENIALAEQESFFAQKQDILNEYEINFPRYNLKTLSDYFKEKGFNVSEEVIQGWMEYNGENIKDKVIDGVIEFLEYLRKRDKKIVILTSRFSKTQIPRLERTGLIRYIDEVVAGDNAMKPDIESFRLAIGETDKKDCLMIGDSLKSDKIGANNAKIDCCIVGNGYSVRNLFDIIRKCEELRNQRKKQ